MTVDTIFDIASLTKVVATTTAVMQLVEKGKVRLNDPVVKYIPEFAQNGKDDITVRDLLTHYSGLPPDLDLTHPWEGRDVGYSMAFASTPIAPPGTRFVYSDVNFIVLAALIERVSGLPLDTYCAQNIFTPLGMSHTRFLPPATLAAANRTHRVRREQNRCCTGVVHDPTVRRMGGVSGQAGLFSTADDLAKFAQALLDGGSILSPLAIEKMTTPQQPPAATALRGLGWDIDSPFSSNRGELAARRLLRPHRIHRHIALDRSHDAHLHHPSYQRCPSARAGIGNCAALQDCDRSCCRPSAHRLRARSPALAKSITGYNEAMTAEHHLAGRNGTVLTGIDVLEAQNFAPLQGKRIGLLTNQTGVDSAGRRTIDVLAHAPGVQLTAIFSPEHGVAGALDTTKIGNSKDAATGVPVYSVYGATDESRRPSQDVLKQLDAVVIDLQDAGVRFYTYETTVGYFLEAAAKAGIAVIVLDRPNPLNGAFVQGPLSEPGRESFTNYGPVPVRHGMTLGELAQMFNDRAQD